MGPPSNFRIEQRKKTHKRLNFKSINLKKQLYNFLYLYISYRHMTPSTEIFKQITDFEDYEISNFGNVRKDNGLNLKPAIDL